MRCWAKASPWFTRNSAGMIALSRLVAKLGTQERDFPAFARTAAWQRPTATMPGDDRQNLVYAVSHDLPDPLQLARRYADMPTTTSRANLASRAASCSVTCSSIDAHAGDAGRAAGLFAAPKCDLINSRSTKRLLDEVLTCSNSRLTDRWQYHAPALFTATLMVDRGFSSFGIRSCRSIPQ